MRLELSGAEAIAVAAHCGKIWPSSVTGVDYTNQMLLEEFLVDGTRSLLSRGLAAEKDGRIALDPRLDKVTTPVFSSPAISAFIGTADDVAETVGGAIYVYRDGAHSIVEIARATGYRQLLELSRSEATHLLRIFAESVYHSDHNQDEASDVVLYVGAPIGPNLPVTVVGPGLLSHGTAPQHHGPVANPQDATQWDAEWVEELFDAVVEA